MVKNVIKLRNVDISRVLSHLTRYLEDQGFNIIFNSDIVWTRFGEVGDRAIGIGYQVYKGSISDQNVMLAVQVLGKTKTIKLELEGKSSESSSKVEEARFTSDVEVTAIASVPVEISKSVIQLFENLGETLKAAGRV